MKKENFLLQKRKLSIDPENFHYKQLQTPDGQSVLEVIIIHRTVMMSDY